MDIVHEMDSSFSNQKAVNLDPLLKKRSVPSSDVTSDANLVPNTKRLRLTGAAGAPNDSIELVQSNSDYLVLMENSITSGSGKEILAPETAVSLDSLAPLMHQGDNNQDYSQTTVSIPSPSPYLSTGEGTSRLGIVHDSQSAQLSSQSDEEDRRLLLGSSMDLSTDFSCPEPSSESIIEKSILESSSRSSTRDLSSLEKEI
jgi:hypothetical protein